MNFQQAYTLLSFFFMDLSPYQRLELFWQSKGLKNASAFADTVPGLTAAALSAMKKRGNLPSSPMMRVIQTAYPDLSADYILAGAGPMLKGARSLTPASQLPPPLPEIVREGFPATPGTATPQEIDFVGRLISQLESEVAGYQEREAEWKIREAWYQEMLKKPLASSNAAGFLVAEPATPISLRPTACQPVECVVRQMWGPGEVAKEQAA